MENARELPSHYVLLVDDDEAIGSVLCEILAEEGIYVAWERDGAAALSFLDRAPIPPSVILLDRRMPGLDGRDTLNALRCSRKLGAIPVVAMSAAADRAWADGVTAFIRKPFELVELLRELRRLLGTD